MASSHSEPDFCLIGPEAPRGFDCGRAEQNDFIHNLACTHTELRASVTYLAMEGEQCVGFITLTPDSIELYGNERPHGLNLPRLPALKVAQLGVDVTAQGRGIAKQLIGYALWIARQVREQIGCVYLSVDAKPHVLGMYKKFGFKRNKAEIRRRREREGDRYDEESTPVSMRLDIREPGEKPANLAAISGVVR
jgi:GNAT superfamily N-acetyltransferase